MEFKCEKCGHVSVPTLKVEEVDNWKRYLTHDLSLKLQHSIKGVEGTTEDGKEFMTLFLSTVFRTTLMGRVLPDLCPKEPTVYEIFCKDIAPVLETIGQQFHIIGCLAPPSTIDLAQIDLHVPRCVFCFVTIEKDNKTLNDIKTLGLVRLLDEGSVDTITGTKSWQTEI